MRNLDHDRFRVGIQFRSQVRILAKTTVLMIAVVAVSGCASGTAWRSSLLEPATDTALAGPREESTPWHRVQKNLRSSLNWSDSESSFPELPDPPKQLNPFQASIHGLEQAVVENPVETASFEVAAPTAGQMIELTEARDLEQLVRDAEVPILVDFYASWCGPCKKQTKILREMNISPNQARIIKVDVDKHPEIAEEYGATSIPTLVVFQGGRPTYRQTGLHDANQLTELLQLR